MKIGLAAPLLLAGSMVSTPANAQATTGQTSNPDPPPRNRGQKLERLLDVAENNVIIHWLASRDGFGLRMGGIEDGSGFAFGPSWQSRQPFGGRLELYASGVVSPARDRAIDAGVRLPGLGGPRFSVHATVGMSHLARESFYGEGHSSVRDHHTVFSLDRRGGGLQAALIATRRLSLSASVQLSTLVAGDAVDARLPAISSRFIAIPTLGVPLSYAVLGTAATIDSRDVPGNPRRGGRYVVRVERHADRTLGRFSFDRLRLDAEHHISWWRRERLITLRALAILSRTDPGNDVPFYLQPTLGGSTWLRGFPTDRFRDRNLLAIQAEYGWDIWPFLNAVVFYEIGQVASHWSGLFASQMKRDYGFGFRFGSARTVAVRADVAFGSGEGARFSMRFSHAF